VLRLILDADPASIWRAFAALAAIALVGIVVYHWWRQNRDG
jgi:hypothetical protein